MCRLSPASNAMKLRDGFSGERSVVLPKMIADMMKTDPVASALHITDIGHYPAAANHFRSRPEPIGEYVLIYCVAGEGWFELDGRRHEVGPDTYFILPAGRPHAYGASAGNPWTIYWIHFSGILAPHYAADCGIPHTVTPAVDSRIRCRTDLFEEIFSTLDSGFSLETVRYAMSLFHHYLGTLRYLREYRSASSAGLHTGEIDTVTAIIHYMEENIERPLTLARLAAYSGYSPSRLSAVFKQRTGHAPMAYFNLIKVRHACHLLDTTPMQLNSICHKVGIADPYYFSRMFRKIMGLSPTAYRQRPRP